jgi:tripartite-type tricarboxylate transporter receptor subunit TctC
MAFKSFVAAMAVAAALCAMAAGAQAQQAWPNHPIRLIVPSAPGASNDVISRTIGQELGKRLGQTVVVENKAGAGGTVGTNFVAKSPPDGYTLLFVSSSLTTNAAAGKDLPYDPVRDLQPISKVASGTFVVVVNNQLPVKTYQDFAAYVRERAGKLNYGSAGVGGISHLGTELLLEASGLKMTHIAYRGMAPAFTDLMSGRVQMALPSLASVKPQLDGGAMRGLATTGSKRSALTPDMPTLAESGLPGFDMEMWWGIFAPTGTPRPIVDRVNRELAGILAMPQTRTIFLREGAEPAYSTPEDLQSLVSAELVRWTKVIGDAHIVVE